MSNKQAIYNKKENNNNYNNKTLWRLDMPIIIIISIVRLSYCQQKCLTMNKKLKLGSFCAFLILKQRHFTTTI